MAHGDQPSAVSEGIVDGGVHAGLWHGAAVLPRSVPVAMAERLSLSRLRSSTPHQLSTRRADLVPGLPASNHPSEWHLVRSDKAATANVVFGHAPVDLDQDQHGRLGADAPSWSELSHVLAAEAQDHASHGRAGTDEATARLRADR